MPASRAAAVSSVCRDPGRLGQRSQCAAAEDLAQGLGLGEEPKCKKWPAPGRECEQDQPNQ